MTSDVFLSGAGDSYTREKIGDMLSRSRTGRLFIASAYASYEGVDQTEEHLSTSGVGDCAAVFGLDGYITQPTAIERARELNWDLRLVGPSRTPFHSKFALAGGIPPSPYLNQADWAYIGSSNFTKGGFQGNIETGVITQNTEFVPALRDIGQKIWEMGHAPGDVDLQTYSERFAERERKRPSDITRPGMGEIEISAEGAGSSGQPDYSAYDNEHASAVWAGLESFTGERTFQLELPRTTAAVVRRFLDGTDGEILVECEDRRRKMEFKFYDDNQMDRLNIPNDVPGIDRVREEESGIALIERTDNPDAPLRLSILFEDSSNSLNPNEIIKLSRRIGSLGETSTRQYGWY